MSGRTIPQPRSICVGTITRHRPLMLQNLLRSYTQMDVPEGVRLHFIIVENNDWLTLQDIVEAFRGQMPQWPVQYSLEPRLGIAFARNRVLDCAIDAGIDLLTFADDDETVRPDWLIQLLAERDAFDLDIVGSPVRLAPPRTKCILLGKTGLVRHGQDEQEQRGKILAQSRPRQS
jgi:glycosyltransferase involved in cell wall biosynthesis